MMMPIRQSASPQQPPAATQYGGTIEQSFLKQQLASGQQSAVTETLATLSDELLLEELGLPTSLFGLETELPQSLTPLMQNQALKARYQRQRLDEMSTVLQTACLAIEQALTLHPRTHVPYSYQLLERLEQRLAQLNTLSHQTDVTLAETVGITAWLPRLHAVWQWWQQPLHVLQALLTKLTPRKTTKHRHIVLQLKGIGLLVPYLNRTPHAQASLEAGVWIETFKQVRNMHATALQQHASNTGTFWR